MDRLNATTIYRAALLAVVMLVLSASSLLAQGRGVEQGNRADDDVLLVSASEDFSTTDRLFTLEATVYVQVNAPEVNGELETNSIELEPVGDGESWEGSLTGDDGTYTASVPVEELHAPETGAWLVKVELEDSEGDGVEAETRIVVDAGEGEETEDGDDGDDDEGDEEDGDDDDELDEDEEEAEEIEVEGVISSAGDGTYTVGEFTFYITDATEIDCERGCTMADIDLDGRYAEVELMGDGEGGYYALEIEVEELYEADDVVVNGRIDELGSGTIVVSGFTFSLSEDVEVRRRGESLALTDLEVDMRVLVKGYDEGGEHPIAYSIRIKENGGKGKGRGGDHADEPEDEEEEGDDEVEDEEDYASGGEGRGRWFAGMYTGTVAFFDAGTSVLLVEDQSFTLSDDTRIRGAKDEPAEGDRVKVWYAETDEGMLALQLVIKGGDEQTHTTVELEGPIEGLSDGEEWWIEVSGLKVYVTADTEILLTEGEPGSFEDLNLDDVVEVEAQGGPDGLVALEVKVEETATIEAEVEAEEDGAIVVAGKRIEVTDETLVIGEDFAILTLDAVQPGAFVAVHAVAKSAAGKVTSTTYVAQTIEVKVAASATQAEDAHAQPRTFALQGNYPNPFNPTTSIVFETYGAGQQTIYNVLGQKVRTLVSASLSAGTHTYQWDGRDDAGQPVASGTYLYRLQTDASATSSTMTLLR